MLLGVGGYLGWKISTLTHSLEQFTKVPWRSSEFESGDLLLFSADPNITSVLTMIMTNSPITHVGIVYEHPFSRHQYVLEVVLEKQFPETLSVSNLYHRIHNYRGTVMLRKLKSSYHSDEIRRKVHDAVMDILYEYPSDLEYRFTFYLATSNRKWWHPPLPQEWARRGMVCMDLVAKMYEKIGAFRIAQDDLLPNDFYSPTECLPLSDHFWLEEERKIDKIPILSYLNRPVRPEGGSAPKANANDIRGSKDYERKDHPTTKSVSVDLS
jgi:hypothetical protein